MILPIPGLVPSSSSAIRPFFSYYGGKWRTAPRYPVPKHRTIVEPFAGSAGYSIRYHHRDVRLYDLDSVVCGVWDYLIHATREEVLRLPLDIPEAGVDEMSICPEAKSLVGFWLNSGASRPKKTPSAWMRKGEHITSFWGEAIRARIASQLLYVRHWSIECRSYEDIEDIEATWFVDPPYQDKGFCYRHGSNDIDFGSLGSWCRSLRGQVVVCEQEGADWLPFQPHLAAKTTMGNPSSEVVWTNG